MAPNIRRAFDRLARAQTQLAEQFGLLTATMQHRLPAMPSTARKSQKRVGKFGVLTTKDANRQMAKRKNKEYEASVRKAGRTAPLGLASTSKRAPEEENVPLTPIGMVQAANRYYHPSFPWKSMCYIAANSFNSIFGYGKIVGIGGTRTWGVGRPWDC